MRAYIIFIKSVLFTVISNLEIFCLMSTWCQKLLIMVSQGALMTTKLELLHLLCLERCKLYSALI